jgi:hypothetical protein
VKVTWEGVFAVGLLSIVIYGFICLIKGIENAAIERAIYRNCQHPHLIERKPNNRIVFRCADGGTIEVDVRNAR